MMKVLIADDEALIREGLKLVVDWDKLGFTICGEASDGDETLKCILELKPDLVLLDIRMPNLQGTEIVQLARAHNYKGHFIIISGFSDFKYAQAAIRYGVDYYLTKPIDEDELSQALSVVKAALDIENQQSDTMNQYREKAKSTILRDILLNINDPHSINYNEINLTASTYQVVIYENYNQENYNLTYSFAELLQVTNQGSQAFESIKIHQKDLILLKGNFAIERLHEFLRHYEVKPQKGSPLDSLLIPSLFPMDVWFINWKISIIPMKML
ncbi:MAG: response regulator [Mobilitalea sp.]